ncbi:MAG: M23 family metallopeptidase [Prevotellaceae bacterium]|nr:M23 family metallopeptidase [Prevotellaceae bacterium]MDY2750181.1 M23 family metallopeptidase [Prevotella sp.]
MSLKKISLLFTVSLLTIVTLPAHAQDLLAKQAPVDRRMKMVDTLALRPAMENEEARLTANALYEDWNNTYAHRATELPDSFRINLKHFCMPTESRVVTSNFGPRWGRTHKGIDIKVYIGDTIRAAFPGKVRMVKYEAAGYGKYVVIRHQNGLETIYGHMSNWLVKEDEVVKAGQPIGLGGNTGRSTGSHLHFETRLCGVALNPALMFDFRNQDVVDDYYMFRKDRYESESIAANQLRGKVGNGSYTAAEVRGEKTQANNAKKERIENKNSEIRYHKVAAGETLYSIAKRRKVTVDDLCRLNHLTRDIKVRPGQLLRYS